LVFSFWLNLPRVTRGSPSCQRAPRVPRARRKYAEGSGAPVLTLLGSSALMMSWGLEQGENHRPRRLSQPRPFRKARAGRRLALGFDWHVVSAFSESVLPGPLRWGFSSHAGCRISPSVGYPGILIPNKLIYRFFFLLQSFFSLPIHSRDDFLQKFSWYMLDNV
jgi:hypothetical protein